MKNENILSHPRYSPFFFKDGSWNSIIDKDVSIGFLVPSIPNESQCLDIRSGHGKTKITFKEVSLSLQETISLRDSLTELINAVKDLKQ